MFNRLEKDIFFYEQHLINTRTQGSQIEQVFVGYVLTIIYAEFEKAIKSAIKDRCHIQGDTLLNNYVRSTTDRIIRSVRISDLSKVLKRFDNKYNDRFRATVGNTNHQTQVSWDNIIDNRHAFAHMAPTNATLIEVQEWFSEAKIVIFAFRAALGLSD